MEKERKQDLSSPEEEALEQRVHEMLDINAVEEPKVDPASVPEDDAPEVISKLPKKVPVSIHEDEPIVSKEPDPELAAAIAATNAELAEQAGTAPVVPAGAKKKVTITHVDDDNSIEPVPPKSKKRIAPLTVPVEETPGPPEIVAEPEPEVSPEAEAPTEPVPQLVKATFSKPTWQPEAPSETDQLESDLMSVGELLDKESVSPLASTIESTETNKAVSDIIAHESDALLDVQSPIPTSKPAKKQKTGPGLFKLFITGSAFRWTIFLLLVAGLTFIGAYPKTRYYALNKAGVKSTASVIIMDKSTLRPLKNAQAVIAGKSVTSDENGKVSFTELPLGPTQLTIKKRAFATHEQSITIGWGSNPLADVSLKPQGDQYTFQVKDVLSGKAVSPVEASVGDFVATADGNGQIKLTLDKVESDTVDVTFNAAGYKDKTIKLDLSDKEPAEVLLSPDKQVAFISKRSGKYDLYKIDADGKNESVVLKGSGNESADIVVLQHPSDAVVMLINTRDAKYTGDGKLQNNLTFVNLKDNSTKTVSSSTQIRAIDWIGSRLVYVTLNDAAEADDPARYKLMSYDYKSGDNRQLATTNYFNSVVSVAGKIYYAPASAYQNGINLGVFAVFADGSGKAPILDQESWNIIRTTYDGLTIAVQQEWYTYKPGDAKASKSAGQPIETASRVYSDSPNAKHSVWVDSRDGKGVLVLYDVAKKSETVLLSQSGVSGPVRWLNNSTIIFRSSTGRETADYVISIDGGAAKKIVDVTNTAGIDRWTY